MSPGKRRSSRSMKAAFGFSLMPMVRLPCTLLWPRTGQSPAPGLPIWPHIRCRLTISRMVSTECLCWVIPIAQQLITLSLWAKILAAWLMASRPSPDWASIWAQSVARTCSRY
ncbi:hypothetical protein D3C81_1252060 [compost metagenome]